mmetsp:Transcript_41930/g.121303  ORF Transcript_41930/g.121303 Transcript_41930/m.121303 type:complete len:208 (-) Transcript_41930:1149-1772(-)
MGGRLQAQCRSPHCLQVHPGRRAPHEVHQRRPRRGRRARVRRRARWHGGGGGQQELGLEGRLEAGAGRPRGAPGAEAEGRARELHGARVLQPRPGGGRRAAGEGPEEDQGAEARRPGRAGPKGEAADGEGHSCLAGPHRQGRVRACGARFTKPWRCVSALHGPVGALLQAEQAVGHESLRPKTVPSPCRSLYWSGTCEQRPAPGRAA